MLTVTGIAVCLSFLVVLSSLSRGMGDYLEDELKKGHTGYIAMRRSPAFTEEEYNLIETIAGDELAKQGYSGRLEVQCVKFLHVEYSTNGFVIIETLYEVVGISPAGIKNPRIEYDFTETLLEGREQVFVAGSNGNLGSQPTIGKVLEGLQVGSLVFSPLLTMDTSVGAILLARTDGASPFSSLDRELLSDLWRATQLCHSGGADRGSPPHVLPVQQPMGLSASWLSVLRLSGEADVLSQRGWCLPALRLSGLQPLPEDHGPPWSVPAC